MPSPAVVGSRRPLAPSAAGLLDQVAWFNRLRLVAAFGMAGLTALAAHGLGALAEPRPLYALALLTLVVDLFYMARFRRLAGVAPRGVRRHVDLQIAIDLAILTAILHWSGGITNPFFLFYLFHAFIAALLLSVRAAFVVVGASVALVSLLAVLERCGLAPHRGLAGGPMDLHRGTAWGLAAWIAAFAATSGLAVYFVGRVVSRLARREEQMLHLNRQLAHSEKLASIGTLAAGVAHEINNPAGVIQNKVQVLRYRVADGAAPDALLEELATVEKHAQRIGTITAGLLAFSRETPFSLLPLDLNVLVREGAELASVPVRTARVGLKLQLSPGRPRVMGSHNHLLQVLVNLILNAVDASAPGAEVTLRTAVEGDRVVLRVEDQGVGIAPENLSKIYDPFFTTKDVGKGTGLGLAITHGIVERHGGTIEVASQLRKGTTFAVWLPRLADEHVR